MKKIKRLIKNIKWLMNNDIPQSLNVTITGKISGNDIYLVSNRANKLSRKTA